ncbi:T9SS type A sorting domain-containing protein, partial [Flavobacterium sp. CAU 1735]|uniref:T9SS type A sorting domain-containing protein n=1 Tax=Flavobacterium sp. CAU 1735 TaxID=3140361 RepID=UPI0032608995
PTEPTHPDDPVVVTDPTTPVEPTEPTHPDDPVVVTDPTTPVEPTEPTHPDDPVVVTDPTTPAEPTLNITNNDHPDKKESIQIWPNPAKNNITLKIKNGTFKKGTMINTNGQIVKQFQTKPSTNINVANLPAGLYLIVLERTDYSTVTRKVMVSRH